MVTGKCAVIVSRRVGVMASAGVLLLTVAGPVSADGILPQIGFSTSGWIAAPGFAGPIRFQGLSGATLESTSPFPLGSFIVLGEPGVTTRYTDTPFGIDLTAPELHRVVNASESGSGITVQYDGWFEVAGHLGGSVTGDGDSTVVATFDGVYPFHRFVGLTTDRVYRSGLPFSVTDIQIPGTMALDSSIAGPTGWANGADGLAVTARIVPEPDPWAISVLAILGGFWSVRRLTAAS